MVDNPETAEVLPDIEITGDDGDLGFHPEADSPAANNPEDKATTKPDGETPSSDAAPDESSPAGKRIKELTSKLQTVEQDPDYLEAKARKLRRDLGQEPAAYRPAEVQPQQPQLGSPAEAEAALTKALAEAPVRTILQMVSAAAEQIAERKIAPIHENLFENTLQQYRMSRSSDPTFKKVQPLFNQLTSRLDRRVLRDKGAEAIWGALEATEMYALGQQYRQDLAKAAETPARGFEPSSAPNMGTGSARPIGTSKATVKIPRTFILMGRAAGLTDREIYEEYVRQQEEEE
jgi:hypothetical protein